MKEATIYQCFPCYKPLPTMRSIESIAFANPKILLDLEDSIQDVLKPDTTPELKAKARRDLAIICKELPNIKFSVRINPINDPEFQQDKKVLRQLAGNIEKVVIPKVENIGDLEAYNKEIGHPFKFDVIVESQKGIENLDDILSSNFAKNIEFVFFGNYDFHLDKNLYPITEQHTMAYWKMVKPIISKIESYDKSFGNSPYTDIADTACLDFSFAKLSKICTRSFGLMSLHKTQTIHFRKLLLRKQNSGICPESQDKKCITADTFITNKLKGRSFALKNNRIITPQEYLLLLRKQNG